MDYTQKFLKQYDPNVRAIALAVRVAIFKVAPDATEKVYTGWHNISFSHGGGMKTMFFAIGPIRDRVNVYFMRGVYLPDPKRLLEGTGKGMRHVKVRTLKNAQSAALKALIQTAATWGTPDK
ncbi:MAG: DUF1801 domain-containing protein [Chloroflexota bacterium]